MIEPSLLSRESPPPLLLGEGIDSSLKRNAGLTRNAGAVPPICGVVLLSLAAALLSRLAVAAGLPAFLNFVHFPLVAFAGLAFVARSRNREVAGLLMGLAGLVSAMAISALINDAGPINVALDALLVAEPILLLLLIIHAPWPARAIHQLQRWTLAFLTLHALAGWYQWMVLGLTSDDVKGIFLHQIGGHHVGGAVAFTGAVYFARVWPGRSRWIRFGFVMLALAIVVLADAKQVIAVALASLLVLGIARMRHIRLALGYFALLLGMTLGVALAAWTFFPALATWARWEIVGMGIAHKLSVFALLGEHQHDSWQVLFGLGPGHSIGRLAWMLPDYRDILGPWGATTAPLTQIIRDANATHWLSAWTGSSMWSLLYSWAGIWGDLGLVGTAIYCTLWLWVWLRICRTDLSRFLLLNMLGLGCVYAWLEEPAYVLLVSALIGLEYQTHAHPQHP